MDDRENSKDCPRRTVYKLTDDDWYPPFILFDDDGQTKLVEVSFIYLAGGTWRVCAWGNDDDGLERDFKNKSDALNCFLNILAMPRVNKVDLCRIGFITA